MTGRDRDRSREVVEAVEAYAVAESDMRHRARRSMALGESEFSVLRDLVAEQSGAGLTPGDVSRRLGASSASTTALLDRLERAGYLHREAHPTDRRRVLLVPSETARAQMDATIGAFERDVEGVARGLRDDEVDIVLAFLARIAAAAGGMTRTGNARQSSI